MSGTSLEEPARALCAATPCGRLDNIEATEDGHAGLSFGFALTSAEGGKRHELKVAPPAARRPAQRQYRCLSPAWGGSGFAHVEMAVIFQAACHSPLGAVAFDIQAPDESNDNLLNRKANEARKRRWLASLAAGEIRAVVAMTEPDGGAVAIVTARTFGQAGEDIGATMHLAGITNRTIAEQTCCDIRAFGIHDGPSEVRRDLRALDIAHGPRGA